MKAGRPRRELGDKLVGRPIMMIAPAILFVRHDNVPNEALHLVRDFKRSVPADPTHRCTAPIVGMPPSAAPAFAGNEMQRI
jgi:hypothetical protein